MEFIVIKRDHQTIDSSPAERWTTTFSKPKQVEQRKRLATLSPTFNSDEVVGTEPPSRSAADSHTQLRLPVIAPAYEAGKPSIENKQLPSPQDAINILPERRPTVLQGHSRLKGAVLLIAFAMVMGGFIGVFAYHAPEPQKSPKETVAQTVHPSTDQSPTAANTDHSITSAADVRTTDEPMANLLLLVEPLVEQVQQEEEIQIAQEVHQKQEDQLVDHHEPELTDEDEAAALAARISKLLENSTGNVDKEDAPLTDAPPTLEPVDQPDIKKPIKITSIQKLGADQLRAMLQTKTPSIDLFQSKQEFDDAKNYIRVRGSFDGSKLVAKQMQLIKEQAIQGSNQRTLRENLLKLEREATDKANDPAPENDPVELLSIHLSEREDLQALPLTMDDQCRANHEEASAIESVSGTLGRLISEASGGARGVTLRNSGNAALRSKKIKENQDKALAQLRALVRPESPPQYLKTTDQILQAQHRQDRLELINTLKGNDNSTAINLLAKRAKYDLSSDVRMSATNALAEFSRDRYRAELLAGLAYPWHVVAQHSAEALVRLDDKEAIPELVEMLDLPHPTAPVEIEPDKFVQPTLVAINHMRNCLLCHAPSLSRKDRATGTVPNWDRPIPRRYYSSGDPKFVSVRADITYLKQDFSVVQPVVNHGPWPDKQRFDFVVQQKPLKPSKVDRTKRKFAKAKNLNREAIVFALQKLTNQSPEDNSSEAWKAILKQQNAVLAQADNR